MHLSCLCISFQLDTYLMEEINLIFSKIFDWFQTVQVDIHLLGHKINFEDSEWMADYSVMPSEQFSALSKNVHT